MSSAFACEHCGARLKIAKAPTKRVKVTCPKCQRSTQLTPDDAVTARPKAKAKTGAAKSTRPTASSASIKRPARHLPLVLAIGGGIALLLLLFVGVSAAGLAYVFLRSDAGNAAAPAPDPAPIAKNQDAAPVKPAPAEPGDAAKLAKLKAELDRLLEEGNPEERKELVLKLQKLEKDIELRKLEAELAAKLAGEEVKDLRKKALAEQQRRNDFLAAMKDAAAAADAKNYAGAITAYEKALGFMPGDADAARKLADVRTAQAAVAAEQRQMELARLKNQAELALMNKRFAVAVELYQAYLMQDKDNAGARAGLKDAQAGLANDVAQKKQLIAFQKHIDAAEKAIALTNYKLAIQEILAAQAINPTSPEIGRLQRVVDLRLAALAKLEPKKVDPPQPDPKKKEADTKLLLAQATAARDAQRWTEAATLYRQLLDLDRSNAQAALGLEIVLQAQKTAQAESDRLVAQSRVALQQNQAVAAIAILQQALRVNPTDAEAAQLLRQAEALLLQQRTALYAAAMDQGNKLRGQLKFKEAMQAFAAALEIFPQDKAARTAHNDVRLLFENDQRGKFSVAIGRGNTLKAQKKYLEALQAFDEALQIHPKDPGVLAARAEVVRLMNTPMVGKDAPPKKKFDPPNPNPPLTPEQTQKFNQAMTQGLNALKAGMFEAAAQHFQAALDIAPGNPQAEAALKVAKSQPKNPKKK